VPSADLHIRDLKLPMLRKGSTPSALTPATLQQRANVEKRDRDSRHPDASFVTIVTHQCHSLSGINTIVWLHFLPHWKETENTDNNKRAKNS